MPTLTSPRAAHGLFAATVFLGAGLVFLIQPLMSKLILPWFGGSPGVWTVCLLFFQSLLFAGYLYAHGLVRWSSPRAQWLIQTTLLALALLSPILPSAGWKPGGDGEPTGEILLLLACHVGPPYLLLCATGPLLQVWFARAFPGESPYRLYALSNLGSLLGLVSYPFVVDVWLSAPQQVGLWYGGFVVYAVLCVMSGFVAARSGFKSNPQRQQGRFESGNPDALADAAGRFSGIETTSTRAAPESPHQPHCLSERTSRGVRLIWFVLAMLPSVLLSAVTNKLSTDVSPVPFLWVAPLTLYLVSLIVCFSAESWSARRLWGLPTVLFVLTSGAVIGLQHGRGSFGSLPFQLIVHLGTLFCVCMVCHGELVRRKPVSVEGTASRRESLTEFYLILSAGGAAGGLFVAVLAPAVFPLFVEHHLGLLAAAILLPLIWGSDAQRQGTLRRRGLVWAGWSCGVVVLAACLTLDIVATLLNVRHISRNFYGVVRVIERQSAPDEPSVLELAHGGTRHGLQLLDPALSRLPTTYFGLTSGVGLALGSHQAHRPRRVGIVGLGVGTLATYGRAGDAFDFYEIDPTIRDLAMNPFRYLKETRAEIALIPGDARLALERREPQRYDLLILDAFSGDAPPIHLLTAEAFEIYRRHLAPKAMVAANISNNFVDLRPVLAGHAERLGWTAAHIVDRTVNDDLFTQPSSWVLMSLRPESLQAGALELATKADLGPSLPWTDARHSLFAVLKRGR